MTGIREIFTHQTENKTLNLATYGAKWIAAAAATALLVRKYPIGVGKATAFSLAGALPIPAFVAGESMLGEDKSEPVAEPVIRYGFGFIAGAQLILLGTALKGCYQGGFRTLSLAGKCAVITGLFISSLELGVIKVSLAKKVFYE